MATVNNASIGLSGNILLD